MDVGRERQPDGQGRTRPPTPGTSRTACSRQRSHDGTVVSHAYDADGVRVRSVTQQPDGATTTVDYLVDTSGPLSHVVAETTQLGAGTAVLRRLLRPRQRPAGASCGRERQRGRGRAASTTPTASAASARSQTKAPLVTDRYAFTAFGELLSHEGEDPNAYLFAGEPLDPNAGFYYNRARWMDPGVGRFASVDPWQGVISAPATLHDYVYVANHPTLLTDPTGLDFSLSAR